MTLGEFINHLKHKSLDLIIWYDRVDNPVFKGNVGSYQYWIKKSKFDNVQIDHILFSEIDEIVINLEMK